MFFTRQEYRIPGIVVITILMPLSLQAQKGDLYRDLRQYAYDRIHPVMYEYKSMLDEELSRPERSRIYDLQEELVQLYQASQDENFNVNTGIREGQQSLMDDLFPFVEQNKDLVRAVLFDAWQIAERHEIMINAMLQELAPQRATWKADLLEIVKRYSTSDIAFQHDETWFNKNFESFFSPANFILWRPEGLLFDFTDPYDGEETFGGIQHFPNPVKEDLNVAFELHRPDTEVYLAVFNSEGKLLNQKTIRYSTTGKKEEQFSLKGSGSGGYFLRIVTTWDSATIRFNKD
jgi:hypothetical protein